MNEARRARSPWAILLAASLLGCGSSASTTKETPNPITASAASPVEGLRSAATPVSPTDLSTVVDWIGAAPIVLLGEASHGTHEFYALRAELTKALIVRGDLDAVAIEGDWTSARRVDRYVRGLSSDDSAAESLSDFERFPTWMWRNEVVADFVEWLRAHNAARPMDERVSFHGLDVYGPAESAAAVVAELAERSPAAAERARERYACLLGRGDEPSQMLDSLASEASCLRRLKQQLHETRALTAGDLDAVQNASVVVNAGRYWNAQLHRNESSWNIRDSHMADTMDRLLAHLAEKDRSPRIAVWAHNSHLGDARATEMGALRGEHNLGQLMRERYGDDVFNLGFSTHRGHVTAVDDWGLPTKRKAVRPGRDASYEDLLHRVALPAFALRLSDPVVKQALAEPRLSRAIGVVYRPQTELQSHYFQSRLPDQFDALIHIDETTALRPLDPPASWQHPLSTS